MPCVEWVGGRGRTGAGICATRFTRIRHGRAHTHRSPGTVPRTGGCARFCAFAFPQLLACPQRQRRHRPGIHGRSTGPAVGR